MITFYTLGAVDLRDDSGAQLAVVLANPKRIALLAYLAVARPRGSHRRDTLLALFWPELDQEHARASLRKAVHHLRRALGDDAVVGLGDEELGLSAARIWCDAAAVGQAIDADDVPRALELYRGPLLKGFFVPDAPEFERWLESERGWLRDRLFTAVWRMAEREERAGTAFDAAFWARRAAALVPDDEEALRRLLALLDRLGDRAGAIAAYEEFARHLRLDYDTEPSAETQRLIRLIRARSAEPERASGMPGAAVPPVAVPSGRMASVTTLPVATASETPLRRARRPRLAGLAALAMVAVAAGAWWVLARGNSEPAPPSATSVAVLPFGFRGHPQFAYLADGMASLLGTSLDGLGGLHGVDPSALLALTDQGPTVRDPSKASSLAARLGAGLYVLGDIVEVSGRLRASAALYASHPGSPLLARATVEDTAPHLFALVDRLAAQLLAYQGGGPGERLTRVAGVTTHSLGALKAYLEGEQRFRSGHYKEAVDAYQRAVAEDSTFALAYYRLASAYSWSSDTMAIPAAVQATRYARRLSPSDRLLVEAFLPFIRGEADEAERRYRAILATRPFEGEAWHPLGEVLFHYNPVRGRPISEARPIFQKALALGPKDSPLTHLLEIEAIEGNYATFDSLLRRIRPGAHFDLVGRTVHAFTSGTEADRRRVLVEVARTPDAELANIGRHMLFLLDHRRGAARVVRLLLEPQRPGEVQALGYILLAHLEMGAGRRRAADSALAAAAELDRGRALEHRGLLHSLPFLQIPTEVRESTLAVLESWSAEGGHPSSVVFPGDEGLREAFRAYVIGLLQAGLGRHDAARRVATELQSLPSTPDQRAFAANLAHGVRARIAWERGRLDDALSELRSLRFESTAADLLGVVPFFSLLPERLLRAEILRLQGRELEALGWYSAFGEHSAFGRAFLAPSHRGQAELHEARGDRDEAARHYARFIEMWKDCDPELRPVVAKARERLARLRSGARPSEVP
jgi:DNA-binding SARP family transcriptional activator/TolB-like protein